MIYVKPTIVLLYNPPFNEQVSILKFEQIMHWILHHK